MQKGKDERSEKKLQIFICVDYIHVIMRCLNKLGEYISLYFEDILIFWNIIKIFFRFFLMMRDIQNMGPD